MKPHFTGYAYDMNFRYYVNIILLVPWEEVSKSISVKGCST
jgi:hypothetical protein